MLARRLPIRLTLITTTLSFPRGWEADMGEPWFGAKAYGVGIGPKSRAGWIAIVAYLVLMATVPVACRSLSWPAWAIPAALGLLTVGFLILMVLKGDGQPWRWRWGGR